MASLRALSSLVLASVVLTACGGGGGGSDPEPSVPDPVNNPVTDPVNDNYVPVLSENFSCGSGGASVTADASPGSYTLFESGPVRPVAWSADGARAFVLNGPANCVEIYAVDGQGFSLEAAVPVGLDPVAVAVKSADELWVVNHLSDSVSIVALDGVPRVRQTLQVGDEPRDIVFASGKAFISAAYRGQNHPQFQADDLTTAGLARADVWVYNADDPGTGLNGEPVTILRLFADSVRGLAVSADGEQVYAAAFLSGNQTTVLDIDAVNRNKPAPNSSEEGIVAPDTGLIVRYRDGAWRDEDDTDWSEQVRFELPDYDLFVIDAAADIPSLTQEISGLGTTLMNVAVNPVDGTVYVSNLEALNEVRFEGPGHSTSTVRGHIAESRITAVRGGNPVPNHLNAHIDFSLAEGESPAASERDRSLSQPTAMAVSPDGETLYVAALGSAKIAAVDTADLHDGSYSADAQRHWATDGGPSGLALSTDGSRLLVYSRFDNSLALLDTDSGAVIASTDLFSPEPAAVITGRRFHYDAVETSANGTSACASCHIFGDLDGLAWDLGNPEGSMLDNSNAYVAASPKMTAAFHPMKGPMTTQTFRGIADSGPLHWRGDRKGQSRATVNGTVESLEAAAFKEFNPAFVGLVGRAEPLGVEAMQAYTDFALAIVPPPNPVRALDNSLTADQRSGRDVYFNASTITGTGSCNHCHALDPAQKHFGTAGRMSFEGGRIDEDFKIPHLRNAYAKVGMFGSSVRQADSSNQGPQVRGFGFLHDGAIDTLDNFFRENVFNFPAPAAESRANVIRFVMVMDSNLAPIVGQQTTLSSAAGQSSLARLDLLEARARSGECDLIVSGSIDGGHYSALYRSDGRYHDTGDANGSGTSIRELAQADGNVLTFTCTPPGSGERLALDR